MAAPTTAGRFGTGAPAPVADQVALGAAAAAALLVPAFFWRGGTNPFGLVKATILATCVVLGVAGWAIARCRTGRSARVAVPAAALPAAAVVAVTAVATATSTEPAISVHGLYSRYSGLVGVLLLAGAAFLVVAGTWRDPRRLRVLVVVGAAAVLVDAAYLLLARAGIDLDWPGGSQIAGTFGNRLFSGAHLAIGVPFLLHLRAAAASTRERWWWTAALAGVVVVLVATDSRGAMLALVAAVAVCGLLAPTTVPRPLTWVAVVVAGAGALLVLGVVVTGSTGWLGPLGNLSVLRSETLLGRIDYWRGALAMIAARPVLGWGPDAFLYGFPPYAPPGMTGRPFPVDKPHDILLERTVETGVLGMAAYLWLVVSILVPVVRDRSRMDEEELLLAGAFGGAFAGYVGQGLTGIDLLPMALLGVVPLAALVVLADRRLVAARRALADEPAPAARPGPWSWVVVGATAVAGVVLLVVLTRPIVADVRTRKALDLVDAVRTKRVPVATLVAAFDRAAATDPWEPRLRGMAAEALAGIHDVDPATIDGAALRLVEDGLAVVPADVPLQQSRAELLGRLGRFEEADAQLLAMERYDPWDPGVRLARAGVLLEWAAASPGDVRDRLRGEARQEVDHFVELHPDSWAPGFVQAGAVYEQLGDKAAAAQAARHALELDPATPGARDLLARVGQPSS